ncbi:MAG: hypothetical protein IPN29_19230 [Saprospiraceae bacterium]|nr:hypothetical protein [Saprospiraceae bacterium]
MNPGTKHEGHLAEHMGFGQRFSGNNRLVNPDGSFNVIRSGSQMSSPYEHLVNVKWPFFLLELLLIFLTINALFALTYWLNGIENLHGKPEDGFQDFLHCFFFSVQTFTTVGYGYLNPQDNYTNVLSSVNSVLGLTCYALATGLLITRFSKADVKITFSDNLLLSPFNDKNSLQLRMVNSGRNTLINMEASSTITWLEDVEGVKRRKFNRLKLELDFIYLFPLNWTLVHIIDESSPFFNKTRAELIAQNTEILVMVRGYDDTYNQYIFKNHSYYIDCLIDNAIFLPMYDSRDSNTLLHIEKLNDYKKL